MIGLVLSVVLYPYELIIQLNPGFTHSHTPLLLLPWKYAPHKAYCHSLKLFYSYTESEHPKIFPCSFLLAIYPRSMLQVSFVIPDVKLSYEEVFHSRSISFLFGLQELLKKKREEKERLMSPVFVKFPSSSSKKIQVLK